MAPGPASFLTGGRDGIQQFVEASAVVDVAARAGRIVTARCTVAGLMRRMELHGVVRGRKVRTTISNPAAVCPLDHVNRFSEAPRPNALWGSDFTYVATWSGFVYMAFVIDAFAQRIVGRRVSRTAHASFVLGRFGAGSAPVPPCPAIDRQRRR